MGTNTIVCLSFCYFFLKMTDVMPMFDHGFFQAFLHHCLICLLRRISVLLEREKGYSLEFTTISVRPGLSISFSEGKELITMTIPP